MYVCLYLSVNATYVCVYHGNHLSHFFLCWLAQVSFRFCLCKSCHVSRTLILLQHDSLGRCDIIVWWLLPPRDGGVLAVVNKGQKREDQSPFVSATAWLSLFVLLNTLCELCNSPQGFTNLTN
jgi:hypothetical protein